MQRATIPDLNDLRMFAAVVDSGSFTAAAHVMGMTKSRISRRIAALEAQLAVGLLQRSTRKIALTEIGQRFYQHCKTIVDEAEVAQAIAEQAQISPRGRVRVTCPVLLTQTVMKFLIVKFMQTYPEVQIHLVSTNRTVDIIEEGFDLAIRFQAAPLKDSSLIVRELKQTHYALYASPAFLKQFGYPKDLEDLAKMKTLGITNNNQVYKWQFTAPNKKQHTITYQPVLIADDWMVIKEAALGGLGIALLPERICREEIKKGRLEQILPTYTLPTATLYLLYSSRRGQASAVRCFIDFLIAHHRFYS